MTGNRAYKRRWDETILSFETIFVLSAHRGDIKYGWMSLSGKRVEEAGKKRGKTWSSIKDEHKGGPSRLEPHFYEIYADEWKRQSELVGPEQVVSG